MVRTSSAIGDAAIAGLAARSGVRRVKLAVAFFLEQSDEWGDVVAEERAVSEDVGPDGVHLHTQRAYRPGALLTVREPRGAFEATARVLECEPLPDGASRLELDFLGHGPTHLLGR